MSAHSHKGLLIANIIWLICIVAALVGGLLRGNSIGVLWLFAFIGALPAVFSLILWPLIRHEWAQILVIVFWLALAIVASLAIKFIPMGLLFLCAPAAAALFEREKVVEAMLISAIFAAIIYYIGQTMDLAFMQSMNGDVQSDWGEKAGIAATISFLVAAMYGAADSRSADASVSSLVQAEIFDALPGGVVHFDDENILTFANGRAKKWFGFPDEFGEIPASILFVRTEDAKAFEHLIQHARKTGQAHAGLFRIPLKNGAEISTEITVSPRGNGDVLVHINNRSHEELRLKKMRNAEALALKNTREKNLFFAGVSHELRTPLNAIIGFSDMMRSRLFGPLPGKYAEYADLIHDSGQHMLDLIGDVLDMSKIEAGKYELTYSYFNLADVIRSSVKMIRPTADASEVQLDVEILDEDHELLIQADRKAIRQILLNLLSNSIKFTPKGGQIVVSAAWVGDIIHLKVKDNGLGMTPEELARVGRPYEQAGGGRTSMERGSGLGLSLVKSLVELHQGRFKIDSMKNSGTTVEIALPATKTD